MLKILSIIMFLTVFVGMLIVGAYIFLKDDITQETIVVTSNKQQSQKEAMGIANTKKIEKNIPQNKDNSKYVERKNDIDWITTIFYILCGILILFLFKKLWKYMVKNSA